MRDIYRDISVQNDEAEDEEMMPEDSANDGFMVPDGQLSEDEGLSSVQQELDTLCADHEGELFRSSSWLIQPDEWQG